MRLILRILVGAYIAYLAIVVLVLTPALNFLPAWFVKNEFDRDLGSDIILFNPFTLSLEARGIRLPEKNGNPFVEFSNATVDLSTENLWSERWVFDEVSLQGLYSHVKQFDDGSFNFSSCYSHNYREFMGGFTRRICDS